MKNLNEQLAQAQRLRETNKLQEAETLYQTILAKYPNELQAVMGLGYVYRQKNQPAQALEYFQKAVALNPGELWPQLCLSEQLRDKQDFATALAVLDTIEKKYPNHFEIIWRKGQIHRIQGNHEQTLLCIKTAINLNPNCLWPQLILSEELRDKNDFAAALSVLDTIEKQYPQHFEIILRRASIYRVQGNREQSLIYSQQAFEINPENIWVRLTLIDELRWHEKFNQAYELINDTLIKEPTNIHLLLRNIYIHRELKQHNQALIELEKAANIHISDFQLNLELATELFNQNKLEQSLEKFSFLQKNHPPNFNVLFSLGQLHRHQGNYSQAIVYFQQSLEIDPNNIQGYIAIVEMLRETQQFDTAWKKLVELEQLYPQRFEVLFQKGLLYRVQNKSDLALICFQQAVTLDPNNLWGQIYLAEELRNQGQFTPALTILEALEVKHENNFHILMQKGHLYRAQNENEQALLCFQQAYTLNNSNADALLQIANEQFNLGQIDNAILSLMQNLTNQPNDLQTLLQIGNWLNIANAKEEALSYFQQALTAHPQQLYPYLNVAQLLFDLGRIEEAFNIFQQAIEQCGERFEVYLNKSQILWVSRELDAAWQCLYQGLNLFPDNFWLQIRRIEFSMQLGQFGAVQQFINTCPADTLDRKIHLQFFSAQLAEKQWQLDGAIEIYQAILKQRENHLPSHEALRRLYLLKLDFVKAKHHALMVTRYRLSEQKINGQIGRGYLHDHIASVTEEYLFNEPMLEQINQVMSLMPNQRLKVLAELVQKEPEYIATSNIFLLELQQQRYFSQGFPKRIFQYWDKPIPPDAVLKFMHSWIKHNPDYFYQLFNDETAREFLRNNYEPQVLMAYLRATHAAQKADLLRLALLYKYGGIYADADDVCLKPLMQWLPQDINILLYHEEKAMLGNNFIASKPQHQLIKKSLDFTVINLLDRDKSSIWLSTGPAILSKALALYLAENWSQASPKELGVMVMTREELMSVVGIHGQLFYKRTGDSWLMKELTSGRKLEVSKLIKR